MSILAKLFRFFPRTRGEEQLIHFSVAISSGTVGAITGNSSFVTSVVHGTTGVYAVTLAKGFPAFLGGVVQVEVGSAPSKETSAALYAVNASAGTFTIYTTQNNALWDPTGNLHVTLFFAANTAPYA